MTVDDLRSLLEYDPCTGLFSWKLKKRGHVNPGDKAGYSCGRGYVYIKIGQKRYSAHRLAWFYVHGVWPSDEIDHINGNRSDNRIKNLREANHAQNTQNSKTRAHNTSGMKGVGLHKGKWRALIRVEGKSKHLGYFATPGDAHAAYCSAATELHGEFARLA
jgi:hypothetical protein